MNIGTKQWQTTDPAWQAAVQGHWKRLEPLVVEVLADPAHSGNEGPGANSTAALVFALTLDAVDRALIGVERAKGPKQLRHRQRALRNISQGSAEFGRRLGASLVAHALNEHPGSTSEQVLELARLRYLSLRDGACLSSEAVA